MAVTNFDTVNGQIVSEYTGTTQLDYLTDALGSVTGICNQSGALVGSARYKPYGATLASSGTRAGVSWVGSKGYRPTGLAHCEFYIRARHDSDIDGRWTTVDPLWPMLEPYGYAMGSPATRKDPTGRQALSPCAGTPRPRPQPLPCLYGNYCGPCNGNGGSDPPIDDLDACCQAHDNCLATVGDWINPIRFRYCQCRLAICAAAANCNWGFKCNSIRIIIGGWAGLGCGAPGPVPQPL